MKTPVSRSSLPGNALGTDVIDAESDSRFVNEIARMGQEVREQNARSGRRLTVWFIAAVAAGIVAWVKQDPTDREVGVAFAAGCLVFIVGWYLHENLCSDDCVPKCPRCGFAWEQEGSGWPPWKHCPGCGLRMKDESTQP